MGGFDSVWQQVQKFDTAPVHSTSMGYSGKSGQYFP
eukprot:symbB.v1.2.037359.t1/scaffold5277.1/size39203/1